MGENFWVLLYQDWIGLNSHIIHQTARRPFPGHRMFQFRSSGHSRINLLCDS
jgi:hypothetical protein